MVFELLTRVDLAEGTHELDGIIVLIKAAFEANAVRMIPIAAVLALYVLAEVILSSANAVTLFFGWPADESLLDWLAL